MPRFLERSIYVQPVLLLSSLLGRTFVFHKLNAMWSELACPRSGAGPAAESLQACLQLLDRKAGLIQLELCRGGDGQSLHLLGQASSILPPVNCALV
jgi:hypothetical protein